MSGYVLLCAPPATDWRLYDLVTLCESAGKGRDATLPIGLPASGPRWLRESA